MIAIHLGFDRQLRAVNSWRLHDTPDGAVALDLRIRVGSGPEVVVEGVRVRFRGAPAPHHCRPVDAETFCVTGPSLHPELGRLEVWLLRAPEEAAAVLRSL